jgi:hypothetical protein
MGSLPLGAGTVGAVIFITPLTILMAEAPNLGHAIPGSIRATRFVDTPIGCAVDLAGAFFLHRPTLRDAVGRLLRHPITRRLRR